MTTRVPAGLFALLAGLLATCLTRPAAGQLDARRVLIRQAWRARDLGDHTRALDLATQAGTIRMVPQLRRFIAEELDASGHPAEALRAATACTREAAEVLRGRDRDETLSACRGLVDQLQPRVGLLVVQVPRPRPAGLRVEIAGVGVPEAEWQLPYPVMPGSVSVVVSAPDRMEFRGTIEVAARATEVVSAPLDAVPPPTPPVDVLPPPLPIPPPSTSVVLSASSTPPPTVRRPVALNARRSGVAPWVMAGAGGVSLAAAAVFYGLSVAALEDRDYCEAHSAQCVESVREEHHDRAEAFLTVAAVTAIAGGTAVATGVVWGIVARRHQEARRVVVSVTPESGGWFLSVHGNL